MLASYPSTDRRLPLYPTLGHNFLLLVRWQVTMEKEGLDPFGYVQIQHEEHCMSCLGGFCNCIPEFLTVDEQELLEIASRAE